MPLFCQRFFLGSRPNYKLYYRVNSKVSGNVFDTLTLLFLEIKRLYKSHAKFTLVATTFIANTLKVYWLTPNQLFSNTLQQAFTGNTSHELAQTLQTAHAYMLFFSQLRSREVVKVCLEYWEYLV